MALQSVDDIHGGDRLPLGVFGVSDSVSNDILQEDFEDAAAFLVNEPRDAFHATAPCEPTDSWFRNSLDVITQHFAMTLSSSLPQALASLATTGHDSHTNEDERSTARLDRYRATESASSHSRLIRDEARRE